jgi:hypothetical protein
MKKLTSTKINLQYVFTRDTSEIKDLPLGYTFYYKEKTLLW